MLKNKKPLSLGGFLLFWMTLAFGGTLLAPQPAQAFEWEGTWKLVITSFRSEDFVVLELKAPENDLIPGTVVNQDEEVPEIGIKEIKLEKEHIHFQFLIAGEEGLEFLGVIPKDEPDAKAVLGSFKTSDVTLSARLERSDSKEISPPGEVEPAIQAVLPLQRETDLEAKIDALEQIIKDYDGSPALYFAYRFLLDAGLESEWDADRIEEVIQDWEANAAPYGPLWLNETRTLALEHFSAMLQGEGKSPYAPIALRLAEQVKANLSEDDTSQLGSVLLVLSKAAEMADQPEKAKAAMNQYREVSKKLDQEYKENVPPFEVTQVDGPEENEGKIVLVELFTSAGCPPCVGIDVAFDGLLETYPNSMMIGLQYHLFSPPPDPLATPISQERAQYYEIPGTPTIKFNGETPSQIYGGGGFELSSRFYRTMKPLIKQAAKGQPTGEVKAEIEVKEEGKIVITANARLLSDEEVTGEANYFLRMALVEKEVRYPGSNGIRFHHQVVRTMPGGSEGVLLDDGSIDSEVEVDLKQVKVQLDDLQRKLVPASEYMELPELNEDHLYLVAFLQNDATQEVLDAVMVKVFTK
ncbi:Hypothetical protein PBC10988_0300 [Planctomycetales bacterium 10988]|nr:Hypothetical protein PBC10988_0300 [Planctomycetales bacterium 10988]